VGKAPYSSLMVKRRAAMFGLIGSMLYAVYPYFTNLRDLANAAHLMDGMKNGFSGLGL
jgi:hypothetical protein